MPVKGLRAFQCLADSLPLTARVGQDAATALNSAAQIPLGFTGHGISPPRPPPRIGLTGVWHIFYSLLNQFYELSVFPLHRLDSLLGLLELGL